MNDISIFKIRISYNDLQTFTLLFLEINIALPLVLILIIYSIKVFIFWIFSLINKNRFYKFLYIPWNHLFRKNYWGLVISDKNFVPISFAKITLIKFERNKDKVIKRIVATTLSDFWGRYLFDYKGEYKKMFLEVEALGFKKYYKEVDTLNHLTENHEMIFDVYLTKNKVGFNPRKSVYFLNLISNILVFLISSIGLLLGVYKILTDSQADGFIFTTAYIFILYITLSDLLKRITLKKLEVLESLLMYKVPGAVVRLYDNKHQLHLAVTNKKGYVLLDWMPGEHQILVTKKGYELIDEGTGIRNKKMYLTNNKYVKLKKKFTQPQKLKNTDKDVKIKTSLSNPFLKN